MLNINLLPARRRHARRMRKRLNLWLIVASVFGVALGAGCMALRARIPEVRSIELEYARVESEITTIHGQLKSLGTDAGRVEQDRLTLETLQGQPDWSLLMRALGAQTGDRAVLRAIRLKPALANAPAIGAIPLATPQKQPSPAQSIQLPEKFTLELSGVCKTSKDASQLVSDLEKLGLFDTVKLIRTGHESFFKDVSSSFDLECTLSDAGGGK